MTIRYLFVAYVFLVVATMLGLKDARAAVLYEVFPPGDHNTGAVIGSVTAFDDLSLSDAASVTSIRWIGRFSTPADQYTIGFYESSSQTSIFRTPLATPFFETTLTGVETPNPLDSLGLSRNYQLDLGAEVALDADTIYFLSIKNINSTFWQWQNGPGGLAFVRLADGRETFTNGTLFFALDGEFEGTNEPPIALAGPPAAALLGLGLIGISVVRRKPFSTSSLR